jgi:hypothetical protein
VALAPGTDHTIAWRVPDMGGQPIAQVGLEIRRPEDSTAAAGTLYLDELTWDGAPQVAFVKPAAGGTMWRHAWVNGVDQYDRWYPETYRLVQNEGTGLLITGTREWADYGFEAAVTPHMAAACGIAARVQGMRRYYALLLTRGADGRGVAQLVKALDGEMVLAEAPCDWALYRPSRLRLEVAGARIRAAVDGRQLFDLTDPQRPLEGGGVAMVCAEGRAAFEEVAVR